MEYRGHAPEQGIFLYCFYQTSPPKNKPVIYIKLFFTAMGCFINPVHCCIKPWNGSIHKARPRKPYYRHDPRNAWFTCDTSIVINIYDLSVVSDAVGIATSCTPGTLICMTALLHYLSTAPLTHSYLGDDKSKRIFEVFGFETRPEKYHWYGFWNIPVLCDIHLHVVFIIGATLDNSPGPKSPRFSTLKTAITCRWKCSYGHRFEVTFPSSGLWMNSDSHCSFPRRALSAQVCSPSMPEPPHMWHIFTTNDRSHLQQQTQYEYLF